MNRDRHDTGEDAGDNPGWDNHGRKDTRDEAFTSRWSRLKRQERTPPAEVSRELAEPGKPSAAPAADERSDEEVLEELGLPDPDTLKAGDDFKAFMTRAVPARIRNRALRRLWTSNPVFANLDRLVDYDHDYTDAAMVPEILRTGYKVGRGWLDDPEEADEAAQGDADPDADPEAGQDTESPAEADAGTVEGERREGTGEETATARSPVEEASERADSAESSADSRGFGDERADSRTDSPADSRARTEGEPRGAAGPRRMRFRFAEK